MFLYIIKSYQLLFQNNLLEQNPWFTHDDKSVEKEKIVEVRVWSDSDFDRISELLQNLTKKNIKYILTIKSAHRTPELMSKAAQAFPTLVVPEAISKQIDTTKYEIAVCIAAAGWAAHIAGMTAAETYVPVIALPVASSATWLTSAFFSMWEMPPGFPNLTITNQEVAVDMADKMLNFDMWQDYNKIAFPDIGKYPDVWEEGLLQKLWLEVDNESPIKIYFEDLDWEPDEYEDDEIPIVIPVSEENLDLLDKEEVWLNWFQKKLYQYKRSQKLEKTRKILQWKGWYMWPNIKAGVRHTNAILQAAHILSINNLEVRKKLQTYKAWLSEVVKQKDIVVLAKQFDIETE